MKYFLVKNDIIKSDSDGNPTWTDEPLWLRNEISTWKEKYGCGGRVWAMEDARYSLIISPRDDLQTISQNDLSEITYDQFVEFMGVAFPPQVIKRDGESDEIITTPIETILKTYWHYAANHTGAINTETWALADNDHHITGNVTLNANQTLTIDPGVNLYFDGNYTITPTAGSGGTTTLYFVGTSALPITVELNASRTGTGTLGAYGWIATVPNNSVYNLQYINITGCGTFLIYTNPTSAVVTVNNIYVRDLTNNFSNHGAAFNGNLTFSKVRVDRCVANSASALIAMNASSTGGGTVSFVDSHFTAVNSLIGGGSSSNVITINFTDCYFSYLSMATTAMPNHILNYTRCILESTAVFIGAASATQNLTVSNSIFCKRNGTTFSTGASSTNTSTFTNCDFLNCIAAAGYALNNASISGASLNANYCYISGHRTADYRNYYTGSETPAQVLGTVAISGGMTTPNFPFTANSITASSITANSVSIAWTGAFRTRNRVRYGTTSGTYNMVAMEYGTWSNADGKGQLSASPTIVLSNLKPLTTYYYVCEAWNWSYETWVTSAEGTFTTLNDKGASPRIKVGSR